MTPKRLFALVIPCALLATTVRADEAVVRQDKVVAGGPKDFLEVRHLVLKGTNEQIGRALATIARERFEVEAPASPDRVRTRAQRKYAEKNYPILADRMRGAAAAYGKKYDDDAFDFSGLWYLSVRAGCSVVHYPPGLTADGTSVVSRNYDFTTGTIDGRKPPKGEAGCTARPYVIEMYPDRGHPSVSVCAYDMLSGALDGINSEGLTVALLADDELSEKYKLEPTMEPAVGLGVLQTVRMLLDTCANVDEAKEALLTTKQYYEMVPVHYLVADRHGKAFVWEYSHAHNKEYIIETPGKPLVTTNFSLHKHLEAGKPPSAAAVKELCPRYCSLAERLADRKEKVNLEFVKETQKLTDFVKPDPRPGRAPTRTLWHALYVPEKRAVQISFYLRDEPDPAKAGQTRVARSDYLEIRVK